MLDVLQEGQTCWRVERATRLSVLYDAAAYFDAFATAVERAERQVIIVGWDVDSRVILRRTEDTQLRLLDLLNTVVQRNRHLDVYVLAWDYSLIYALEREWWPLYSFGAKTDRRVHFELDDVHPPGASQHQKIVIIDDDVAFVGGIDLALHRWDTPDHSDEDERRIDPKGQPYAPFHDMQVVLSGAAAGALGALARERWYRATGERLRAGEDEQTDCWPEQVAVDMRDVSIGITRTQPAYKTYREIREVEHLYETLFRASERLIYVENQYFTAGGLADVLEERLRADDGPEVVLVFPKQASGWLETSTMDALRDRIISRLRKADQHNRLRVMYPAVRSNGTLTPIYVHAKLIICDDRILRIGSANLSNRSMGLDSECDIVVEANDDEQAGWIRRTRHQLLAEHTGFSVAEIEEHEKAERSLLTLLDRQPEDARHQLIPIAADVETWIGEHVSEPPFDPPAPVELETFLTRLAPEPETKRVSTYVVVFVAILLLLVGFAVAWRFGPLSEWLSPASLKQWAKMLQNSSFSFVLVPIVFAFAALLMIPVTLLIVVCGAVYGSLWGTLYAALGIALSSYAGFVAGSAVGRRTVRRMTGSTLNRISQWLGRGGIPGIALIRIFPVAPYTVVNLVAGASHLPLRHFLPGTLLSMVPGAAGLVFFGKTLADFVHAPSWFTAVGAAIVFVVLLGAGFGVRWIAGRKHQS